MIPRRFIVERSYLEFHDGKPVKGKRLHYWVYDTLTSEHIIAHKTRKEAESAAKQWNDKEMAKPANCWGFRWNATPEDRRASFILIRGGKAA